MTKEEFYKEGNQVLTDAEYQVVSSAFDKAEEMCTDIIENLREGISGIMSKLYEKRSSTEFVGQRFTIINRIEDITIIERRVDSTDETSIYDINSVDKLMDIYAELI